MHDLHRISGETWLVAFNSVLWSYGADLRWSQTTVCLHSHSRIQVRYGKMFSINMCFSISPFVCSVKYRFRGKQSDVVFMRICRLLPSTLAMCDHHNMSTIFCRAIRIQGRNSPHLNHEGSQACLHCRLDPSHPSPEGGIPTLPRAKSRN
jgi:hypothetical protein